jgi:hypothetical protein
MDYSTNLPRASAYPHSPGWKGDAETGREVAIAIAPMAKCLRERVLNYFTIHAPCAFNCEAVSTALGVTVYNVRPRISELVAAKKLKPTGERVKNDAGYTTVMWRVC